MYRRNYILKTNLLNNIIKKIPNGRGWSGRFIEPDGLGFVIFIPDFILFVTDLNLFFGVSDYSQYLAVTILQ